MTAPRPWMKFHPRDWQADEGLAVCSLAARGLWIELLCIMHQAEPYGHLLMKGQQPSEKRLSLLLRVSMVDLSKGLAELEENGVFSRTDEGVIYSRRMVEDERKHEEASKLGSKGAARRYQKNNEKGRPHRVGHREAQGEAHNLESEEERESEIPPVVPQGGQKHRIPDDWAPIDFGSDTQSRRIVEGWDEERLATELEAFQAHHRTANSRYSDWQATWSTWVLNTRKFERARAPAAPRDHADIVLEEYEARAPQSRPEQRAGAL